MQKLELTYWLIADMDMFDLVVRDGNYISSL